ncbi:o-succinylbenzoate synthase [Roseofilum casamattae]|uniref:o-succinylbenzoate synthase n=1 Tax=Roseofilum casamattae BLCC-M143 TaxID=3022442 RepID=A0ABT7C2B9_9CYAN|nr:o-succinylbenzoate synthase [Roseofilum casamattae]MDJ1184894.1 o-succinylbenzoate synthase [Roseofilum casamattae BLCC-M143]
MGIDFHKSKDTRNYRVRYQPYCRQFQQPLQTHHGLWSHREGILIQLSALDSGDRLREGWGEIAPLPWFGSESVTEALNFCRSFPDTIRAVDLVKVPDRLPACQFGFESAFIDLHPSGTKSNRFKYCGLLPTGKAALNPELSVWRSGYSTLKWKIGVAEMSEELDLFHQLISNLPIGMQLRLDANGGLSTTQAREWLGACEHAPIEFLEQPLAVSEFAAMQRLAAEYSTPIALDESVATFPQLVQCYEKGWQGIMVVKPAICGFPSKLHQFCHEHPIDLVLSSVLETAIARRTILRLAATLPNLHRPLGLGTGHWFADSAPVDTART